MSSHIRRPKHTNGMHIGHNHLETVLYHCLSGDFHSELKTSQGGSALVFFAMVYANPNVCCLAFVEVKISFPVVILVVTLLILVMRNNRWCFSVFSWTCIASVPSSQRLVLSFDCGSQRRLKTIICSRRSPSLRSTS